MSSDPALKKCPYCAEDIQAEAIKCKHCGSDLTGTPVVAPGKKKGSSTLLLIVLVIIACIAVIVISSSMSQGSSASAPDKIDACIMAQQFVEQRLSAPASAEFQNCYDASIIAQGSGKFRVSSYVDSQNAFGAMLRTYYIAQVQYAGNDQWRLIDLEIGE